MQIKNLLFAFSISVLLLPGFSELQGADAKWESSKFLPGLTGNFSVRLALPDNFIVEPLEDDLDVEGGLLWGEHKILESYRENLGAQKLAGPFFLVTKTTTVTQAGPNKFNVEDKLEEQLKARGIKDLVVKKTSWGAYPVLHFRGVRRDGNITAGAWVGINSTDGSTISITFRGRSTESKLQEEDERIWREFLAGTK